MQRFENARRDAELLGYVLGESARPNRKNKKSRTKTKNEKHEKTKVSDRMKAPPTSLCQTSFFSSEEVL